MPSILIIDDDVALLARLAAQLEEAGFPTARTGDLAHAETLYNAERPDLVILEPRSRDGSGWVLLERFAAETPVVVLSAAASEEDVVRGMEAGAIDYLAKPYRSAELIARLRSRLAQSGMLVQAAAEPIAAGARASEPVAPSPPPKRAVSRRRNGREVEEEPVFMSEAEEMALLRLPPTPAENRPAPAAADQVLQSFGQRMRAERLRRHLTLVQAENELRIRMSYLQAMEDEKFTLLPRGPAALQMVRSYAEFLGLDATAVLDEFRSQHYVDSNEPIPALGGSPLPRTFPRWAVPLAAVLLALAVGVGGILLLDPSFFVRSGEAVAGLWAQILRLLGAG